jgi:4-amino-4-deoxy-L-arabinose transferase-like glycosyltransferase
MNTETAVLSPSVPLETDRASERSSLTPLLTILFVAAVLRLGLWFYFADRPLRIFDEVQYNDIATNLVQDGEFALEKGRPSASRPPLYPAFLALTYRIFGLDNFAVVRFFQAILSLLTAVVVYYLGRELLPRKAALILTGLYAFYPSLLVFNNLILTETLFTFLLSSMTYALVRSLRGTTLGWLAVGGVFCGLGALTRSALYLFPPLAGIWLVFALKGGWGRRLLAAIVFGLTAYGTMLPWAIRNTQLEQAVVVIDTMGGRNFMMGNYRYTPLYRSWDAISLQGEQSWDTEIRNEYPYEKWSTQGKTDKIALRKGLAFVFQNPLLTLQRDTIKFFQFWGLERELIAGAGRGYFGTMPLWLIVLLGGIQLIGYVAIFFAGILGTFLAPPTDRRAHVLLLMIVVFICGLHTAVFAHSRYHLPLMPLLMVYAASLLAQLRTVWAQRRAVWAGCVVCAVFLAGWGWEVMVVESDRIRALIQ